MQTDNKHHTFEVVFLVLLIFLFAVSASMIILIGSNIYKHIIQNMDLNYDTRTSYAYLTEKIHSLDEDGSLSITKSGDTPVISISQDISGKTYRTMIYANDGYLCELFTDQSADMVPLSSGQHITACKSLDLTQIGDQLYSVTMNINDKEAVHLFISTHSQPSEESQE